MKELSFEAYVEDKTPHLVAELICLNCHHRWIGVWPETLLLKDITCPHCESTGTIITTGQQLSEEDYGIT